MQLNSLVCFIARVVDHRVRVSRPHCSLTRVLRMQNKSRRLEIALRRRCTVVPEQRLQQRPQHPSSRLPCSAITRLALPAFRETPQLPSPKLSPAGWIVAPCAIRTRFNPVRWDWRRQHALSQRQPAAAGARRHEGHLRHREERCGVPEAQNGGFTPGEGCRSCWVFAIRHGGAGFKLGRYTLLSCRPSNLLPPSALGLTRMRVSERQPS